MRVEESIIINRSAEDVIAFLADREHDSVWMASVVESEWLKPDAGDTDSPTTVGRRGRMVMKNLGRRLEYVDEVTDYEPGRRIAHRRVEGPIDLNTACLTNRWVKRAVRRSLVRPIASSEARSGRWPIRSLQDLSAAASGPISPS